MQKFENYVMGVDMSDLEPTYKEIKEIAGEVPPWTVMSNKETKGYVIFLPSDEIIHISHENLKWVGAQINTIR